MLLYRKDWYSSGGGVVEQCCYCCRYRYRLAIYHLRYLAVAGIEGCPLVSGSEELSKMLGDLCWHRLGEEVL